MMIATICLYGLVSVLESVSVKFLALYMYLVSKLSEKVVLGIGSPLVINGIWFKHSVWTHQIITDYNYMKQDWDDYTSVSSHKAY